MNELKVALDEMTALEEALNSPHKVTPELGARSHQFLTDAEAAHEKRRKAALATLKKASSSLLLVDSDTLRQACSDAELAGVDKGALSASHKLLGLAEKRQAATSKLTRLAGTEGAEADLKEARSAQTQVEYCRILAQLKQTARCPLEPYSVARNSPSDRDADGPYGTCKPVSQLGSVRSHGNGWRVVATIEDRTICGPYRVNKSDADIDLNQVRTAKTRREYAGILWQLKETIRATASSETEEDASVTSDEVREMPPQTEKRRESQLQPEAMKEEADDSGTRWRWT